MVLAPNNGPISNTDFAPLRVSLPKQHRHSCISSIVVVGILMSFSFKISYSC